MPPDAPSAGSPADWLRHARSDLALAGVRKTRKLLYEHLCFHAQQAAEKALKAVLVHHKIRVPKSHDLGYLMDLLPGDVSVPVSLVDLPVLTTYAVQQRYPAEVPPLTNKNRQHAVQLAEAAVSWASQMTHDKRKAAKGLQKPGDKKRAK